MQATKQQKRLGSVTFLAISSGCRRGEILSCEEGVGVHEERGAARQHTQEHTTLKR